MTGQLRLILPLVWLAGAITAWEAVQTFLQAITASWLQQLAPAMPQIWQLISAQLAAGVAYYAVNLTLLMLVLSRISRVRLPQMIVWGLRDSALVNLTLISIAVVMARLW